MSLRFLPGLLTNRMILANQSNFNVALQFYNPLFNCFKEKAGRHQFKTELPCGHTWLVWWVYGATQPYHLNFDSQISQWTSPPPPPLSSSSVFFSEQPSPLPHVNFWIISAVISKAATTAWKSLLCGLFVYTIIFILFPLSLHCFPRLEDSTILFLYLSNSSWLLGN